METCEKDRENQKEDVEEIAAPLVDGFPLLAGGGARLGSIRHLVVSKQTGQVLIAVVTLGGIFPIGERYYPVPWSILKFDGPLGAYVTDASRRQLHRAPSYERGDEPLYSRSYCDLVCRHYGATFEE